MSSPVFTIDPTLANPKAICFVAPDGAVTFDWPEIEKAGARGHQYALAFLAARDAGRAAQATIPTLDGRTVNDACWAMIDALPEMVRGPNWAEFKPAFYKALELVHREHYANDTAPAAKVEPQCRCRVLGDHDGVNHHPLCRDAAPTAPAEPRKPLTDEQIDSVIITVAELPDRTSPFDWPEAMLVTSGELRNILRSIPTAPAEPQSLVSELVYALREIADDYADRFDLDSPSTNPGIKSTIKQARAAIAKAGGITTEGA